MPRHGAPPEGLGSNGTGTRGQPSGQLEWILPAKLDMGPKGVVRSPCGRGPTSKLAAAPDKGPGEAKVMAGRVNGLGGPDPEYGP